MISDSIRFSPGAPGCVFYTSLSRDWECIQSQKKKFRFISDFQILQSFRVCRVCRVKKETNNECCWSSAVMPKKEGLALEILVQLERRYVRKG